MQTPLIIAHRGDSTRALENSLEAIRLALSVPVDMIELDLRKSLDNRLYVMHDRDTGRTADKNIDIEQATEEDMAQIKLKNGEHVPTLDEVLTLIAGKVGLNLELKSEGAGALCAAHLIGAGYKGKTLISSFKEKEVIEARRVAPNFPASVIFDDFSVRDAAGYRAKGYSIISLRKKTVAPELIDACHEKNIKVYVWTVDEEDEIRRFIEWGVDGMYSNKPMVLKWVVDGLS